MTEDGFLTRGRARVLQDGKEIHGVQEVTITFGKLADSMERSAASMRRFVDSYRDHRLWRASGRRLGPPCARCALPMTYEIECRWWRCRCGHVVLREDVGYRGWRWWLFRWTGVTT
jgi:hypothetical protein